MTSPLSLRTVRAVRYVQPLREGGSVPALVEADDLGLYVVKLRGASQGKKALIAELVAGELARALDLRIPELVLVHVDQALAASEPDPELALPLEGSEGQNIGLDYLPGSITFDVAVRSTLPTDPVEASRVVLFDALVMNVDRTPRNPNLLVWHRRTWLIDHGASLYFHHGWSADNPLADARDPFVEVRDHVLLRWASELDAAAAHVLSRWTPARIDAVAQAIPEQWLGGDHNFASPAEERAAYASWLGARVEALPLVLAEAKRAHAGV